MKKRTSDFPKTCLTIYVKSCSLCLFVFLAFAKTTQAQQKKITGPVIEEYGLTYTVPDPDLETEKTKEFKVVFDIKDAAENPAKVNRLFETVARFLNMHANAGVPLKNLKPVMVVHGGAAFGLLKNKFYKEKYGVDNPNLDLLNKLHAAGIPVILCGQTAGARDISAKKRWEHTQMALSAMTALIQYQNMEYRLIAF